MQSKRDKKIIIIVVISLAVFFLVYLFKFKQISNPIIQNNPPNTVKNTDSVNNDVDEPVLEPQQKTEYYLYTISETTPLSQLKKDLSREDFQTMLAINRIDEKFIGVGSKLVAPKTFISNINTGANSSTNSFINYSPFPKNITSLNNVPKIILISQKVQAFGVYQNGILIYSGPVSTGKQSTKTPNGLLNANWKAKKSTSTVDSSWILPWVVNLDNFDGISMHQYELPGRPASHSCIRMKNDDAMFVYNFIDQWQLSSDGSTVVAKGTPVIIFGDYAYDKVRPWINLVTNPDYLNISEDEINNVLEKEGFSTVSFQ